MKKILFLAFLFVSSAACSDNNQVQFIDGWIKQLPPVVPMRAGYVQISNLSDEPKKIIALQSSAFETVEMHETKMDEGMMKMIELESFDIPAKGKIELKPGGKHMMLIAPTSPLKIGEEVEVIVTFEDSSTKSVLLMVKK